MAGGAKVNYTIGGMGMKPDIGVKNVSAGKFTKATRQMKPKINKKDLTTI